MHSSRLDSALEIQYTQLSLGLSVRMCVRTLAKGMVDGIKARKEKQTNNLIRYTLDPLASPVGL